MKPRTRIRSLMMDIIISESRRRSRHRRSAMRRKLLGQPPTIHYFHQVDDPYSHMAVQKLDALHETYQVEVAPHLVSLAPPEYLGDASRFKSWALRDARSVATFYGTELPEVVDAVDATQAGNAASQLTAALATDSGRREFTKLAIELGNALWRGEEVERGLADPSPEIVAGNRLRTQLGHYLGAMFYFEGEWYWGLDRLCHLEARLADMGLGTGQVAPRPIAETTTNAHHVTLEFFPSLRSPYTAISFERTIAMAQRTGVTLQLKPVMPMMMRGIPAPRPKQLYIMRDAKREADFAGVPFGNIIDPFGEPVKRAFSLLPYMQSVGKDVDYCAAYLRGAWTQGTDITTDAGIRQVVEAAGADWGEAQAHLGTADWDPMLEANLQDMLGAGLWGVPSFRVSGGAEPEPFACWGQDRLWRVETEIARRANARNQGESPLD